MSEEHCTANRKLAKTIEITQLINIGNKEVNQQEENLCERHNQVLGLFCEEDLEMFCSDCVQPHDQQGHYVWFLEEAASYYRDKVNSSTTLLMEHLGKSELVEKRQDIVFQEVRDQRSQHKSKVTSGSEHLNELVDREQRTAFCRLAQERRTIWREQTRISLTSKTTSPPSNALFQEALERSVMSDMNILSEVKRIHHRCASLQVPTVCSFQLWREGYCFPPQDSALEKIQQKFKAEVTLDPHTADPHLCVSKDKRSVTLRKRRSKVLQRQQPIPFDLQVLGSQEFLAGRHYWEFPI
ncbi:tripartite motif-containing protein 75-like [Erinaceus europaeus]|uniref:Tripartite motif-containing protein 75 n=1 Tax=Erinaceus europaeus TaxID=9365 RepID=A0A1S3ARA9_ERIEU|nr:tripartite motif-containing protein 75-like [Erinaceus europaeus]XP_060035127.1 tripartite motif-containing protein 75-like [Erinaceus europaeus]